MIVEVTFSPEKRRDISLKSLTEVNITYKKDHTTRNGTDIFLFNVSVLIFPDIEILTKQIKTGY